MQYLKTISAYRKAQRPNVKRAKIDARVVTIGEFKTWINVPWDKATRTTIQEYIVHLGFEGKSNNTIADIFNTLKAFYKVAKELGDVTNNPCDGMSITKTPTMKADTLSHQEFRDIIEHDTDMTFEGLKRRAIAELLYMGMTMGDIIRFKSQYIILNRIQIAPRRRIYFTATGREVLDLYLEAKRKYGLPCGLKPNILCKGLKEGEKRICPFENYVFGGVKTNTLGIPITKQQIRTIIKKLGYDSGLGYSLTPELFWESGRRNISA